MYSGLARCAAVAYDAGVRSRINLVQMTAFADAESGCQLIPNSTGSPAMGAWQIEYTNGYSASLLLSSWAYNGWAMSRMSAGGSNWQPWTGDPEYGCAPSGMCWSEVYRAVDQVLGAG